MQASLSLCLPDTPIERRLGDAVHLADFRYRVPLLVVESGDRLALPLPELVIPPSPPAPGPGRIQPGPGPFADQVPLEFRQRTEDGVLPVRLPEPFRRIW